MTRLLALSRILSFVLVGREFLVPNAHSILGSVLPSVSSDSTAIREKAIETNSCISLLMKMWGTLTLSMLTILQQICLQLRSESIKLTLGIKR